MAQQENRGNGCIALGVLLLILLGLGWVLLPRVLWGQRQPYNARIEARTYVGSMGRGQQAYYIERGEFAATVAALELGLGTETEHYFYQTEKLNEYVVQNSAIAKGENLRSVIGLVWQVAGTSENGGRETRAQLCESDQLTDSALVPSPSRLVRVLQWFRSETAVSPEILADALPLVAVPDTAVAPEVTLPCPAGYSALQ